MNIVRGVANLYLNWRPSYLNNGQPQFASMPSHYHHSKGSPYDDRVDIPDAELLKLFEEFSTMDEKTRSVAKELLDSLLFKKRVAQEFEKRGSQKENTR